MIRTPRRVANKIILLVLSLELFSIMLWGTLTYSGSRAEILKTISSQLSEVSSRTSSDIRNFFLPISIEADVLSSVLASGTSDNHLRIELLLHRFMNSRPEIEQVSLIDRSGEEIHKISRMAGISSDDLQRLDEDRLVRSALNGEGSTSTIIFSDYLEPIIRIAYPIQSSTKWGGHALLVVLNLKWLWDTVQSQNIGQSGYVYIVDESLKLVAHPDPSLVLKDMRLTDTGIPQQFFSEQGIQDLKIYTSLTGVEVAGVSRFDPLHRWWVIVEQPVEEGLAPLDRVINRFILALMLAAIVTIFIVFFFAKVTMLPLRKVEYGITRLARGDRNVRVDIPKHTELATLAEAFNTMACNLDAQKEELEYQANHDPLTDLPNRQLLYRHLKQRTAEYTSSADAFSLLLLDLDRFKEINDSLGHKYGDLLLKLLKPRLQKFVVEGDVIARLGGDEFAFSLQSVTEPEQAVAIAQQIRRSIQEPFNIEGMQIQIDGSIGIAMFPTHGQDSSTLLRRADVAMYQAKQTGRGIAEYDRDLDIHSPERLALIGGLRKAIDDDELVLFYQPKIRIEDRSIIAVEALVRWNHPEHGLIPPDEFIPFGELGDAIILLTNWVIDHALADYKRWQAAGMNFTVAVNISVMNMQDLDFISSLNDLINNHRIDPGHLQLEITESVIMSDSVRAMDTVNALSAMGVSIAIDDFGTGYSSLNHLREMQVNELKIDKSFVMDMMNNENDAVIVHSTVNLAHNLGLQVTAEGVESKEIMDTLELLECDYAQGFHICRPIPAQEIGAWVDTWYQDSQPVLSK